MSDKTLFILCTIIYGCLCEQYFELPLHRLLAVEGLQVHDKTMNIERNTDKNTQHRSKIHASIAEIPLAYINSNPFGHGIMAFAVIHAFGS